jgi:hypothetical protein
VALAKTGITVFAIRTPLTRRFAAPSPDGRRSEFANATRVEKARGSRLVSVKFADIVA